MNFLSIIVDSSALMYVLAFVFAVFCIRCMIYGIADGTSVLVKIICTVLFAGIAYYLYHRASYLSGPNPIDDFVFDTWVELKKFIAFIKTKI